MFRRGGCFNPIQFSLDAFVLVVVYFVAMKIYRNAVQFCFVARLLLFYCDEHPFYSRAFAFPSSQQEHMLFLIVTCPC